MPFTPFPTLGLTADTTEDEMASDTAGGIALFAVDSEAKSSATDEGLMDQQASMILSAMDAAGEGRELAPWTAQRREAETDRLPFRCKGKLRLFADLDGAAPWPLFLRDIEPRAAGFICPDRLPLGYGGTLSFEDEAGQSVTVDVTLVRCRVCYGGWFEGALYFHRNQPQLLPRLRAAAK